MRRITGEISSLNWSFDSKNLSYTQKSFGDNYHRNLLSIDTGKVKELSTLTLSDGVREWAYSPDGKWHAESVNVNDSYDNFFLIPHANMNNRIKLVKTLHGSEIDYIEWLLGGKNILIEAIHGE